MIVKKKRKLLAYKNRIIIVTGGRAYDSTFFKAF